MESELLLMTTNKILQTQAYTAMLLGNETKRFAIYTESSVGMHIQSYLAEENPPRPFSHDLLLQLLKGLDASILQVVIHDCKESIFFARLFVEQLRKDERLIIEIDARPSDCIPLAMMNNIPIYCTRELFDQAVPTEDSNSR